MAAFVPINRGADFFDRFAHFNETVTISPTRWNDYSVGALQCAMTLDIVETVSVADQTPTRLRFTYLQGGLRRTMNFELAPNVVSNLQTGFIRAVGENNSATFAEPVDVAYGEDGSYFYKKNILGEIRFDNDTFGDPIYGTYKYGYWRPRAPFEVKSLPLPSGQKCIAIYPERFSRFLSSIGADGPAVNNSIVVNVDYPGSANLSRPSIPCTDNDFGVVLQECGDLTAFTEGFSLVTNLRLYIADNFNIVETTAPDGYIPPNGRSFFPPSSLFSPEKRYGFDFDPYFIEVNGQVGSVASENVVTPIRPMDATGVSGTEMTANRIRMNLSSIRHPVELPPIFMMNWLVVMEERRAEFSN